MMIRNVLKIIALDTLGVLVMPLISFVTFVTFFTEESIRNTHGGILIYGVSYAFVCLILVLPILFLLSMLYQAMTAENKYWIKLLPLGGWLFYLFYLQCPFFNSGTEYKVFDSLTYSLLYLGLAVVFVVWYFRKLKTFNV